MKDIRARFLPYCLQKMDHGWIILNREYKPLGYKEGFKADDMVDYETHRSVVSIPGLTERVQRLISWNGEPINDDGQLWLYTEATIPVDDARSAKSYFERLLRLMKLKIKPAGAVKKSKPRLSENRV